MSEQKTFYFKVEGRIYADDEDDVYDQIYNLLEGRTERFRTIEVEEVD